MPSIVSFQMRRIMATFTLVQTIGNKQNHGIIVGQNSHIQFMRFWKSMTIHVEVTFAGKATFACENHLLYRRIIFYIHSPPNMIDPILVRTNDCKSLRYIPWVTNDSFDSLNYSIHSDKTHSIRFLLDSFGQNSFYSQNYSIHSDKTHSILKMKNVQKCPGRFCPDFFSVRHFRSKLFRVCDGLRKEG